jgi:hypothetical protein
MYEVEQKSHSLHIIGKMPKSIFLLNITQNDESIYQTTRANIPNSGCIIRIEVAGHTGNKCCTSIYVFCRDSDAMSMFLCFTRAATGWCLKGIHHKN